MKDFLEDLIGHVFGEGDTEDDVNKKNESDKSSANPTEEEREYLRQNGISDDGNNGDNNNDDDNKDDDEQKQPAADDELEDYPAQLIEDYKLKTLDDTDDMYWYHEAHGVFLPNAEPIIKARIEEDLGHPFINEEGNVEESHLTIGQVNEYLGHIQRRTPIKREDFNPRIEWLASDNCMINLLTGETAAFSPDFMNTTHIPITYVKYNPEHVHTVNDFRRSNGTGFIADFFRLVECPCPKIMKFLYEIITPEDVELVLDFMAYCLWRNYEYNFWMLFHGAGFNGKSILLNLIERFFGAENVSGETLDRLLKERFSVAQLFQKMVNVDADVSADVVFRNTGIIKKLTGNDLHAGEFKYKKPFAFRNFAKLYFSCNKIPETEDETDAFFRRIIVINFTQQFFGEKENPNLINELCTEEEFSGLLYELISRLPKILKQGFRKVTNEAMEQTYDKYTRGSNPVKYFVEKGMQVVAGFKVPKLDLYNHYYKFCGDFGLTPESPQSFSRKLKESGFQVKRFKIKGEGVYCYVDIQTKDWVKEERDALESLEDFSDATKEEFK